MDKWPSQQHCQQELVAAVTSHDLLAVVPSASVQKPKLPWPALPVEVVSAHTPHSVAPGSQTAARQAQAESTQSRT